MNSTDPKRRSYSRNSLPTSQLGLDLRPASLNRDSVITEEITHELGSFYHKPSKKWISITAKTVDHRPEFPNLMGLDKIRFCNDLPYPDGRTYANKLKISSDRITVYQEYQEDFGRSSAQVETVRNLTRGKYNGFVSSQSARQIRKKLDSWFECIAINAAHYHGKHNPKHSKITFATLTLPADQVHDDREIKRKCLMPFIQQLSRVAEVDQWFWKAEPQENGNVHFHILMDRYVRKEVLDSLWFAAMDRLGYIDRYADKHGKEMPPMCNIKVCPDDTSLISYVMKYVSKAPIRIPSFKVVDGQRVKTSRHWIRKKDDQHRYYWAEWRPIAGRVWGMSDKLRSIDQHSVYMSYRVEDLLVHLDWFPEVRRFDVDYATVYFCDVKRVLAKVDQRLLRNYLNHHLTCYRNLYLINQAKSVSPP